MSTMRRLSAVVGLVILAGGGILACSNKGGEMVFNGRPSTDPPDMYWIYYQVNEDFFSRSKLNEAPDLILSNKKLGNSVNVKNVHKLADLSSIEEGQWIMVLSHEIPTSTTVHFCRAHTPNEKSAPDGTLASVVWERLCFMETKDLETWQKLSNSIRVPGAK